ncbi:MAG: hypothetical protein AAGA27_06260 [Pseudomonadota bacterium]
MASILNSNFVFVNFHFHLFSSPVTVIPFIVIPAFAGMTGE